MKQLLSYFILTTLISCNSGSDGKVTLDEGTSSASVVGQGELLSETSPTLDGWIQNGSGLDILRNSAIGIEVTAKQYTSGPSCLSAAPSISRTITNNATQASFKFELTPEYFKAEYSPMIDVSFVVANKAYFVSVTNNLITLYKGRQMFDQINNETYYIKDVSSRQEASFDLEVLKKYQFSLATDDEKATLSIDDVYISEIENIDNTSPSTGYVQINFSILSNGIKELSELECRRSAYARMSVNSVEISN